jgi:hypothetical protein
MNTHSLSHGTRTSHAPSTDSSSTRTARASGSHAGWVGSFADSWMVDEQERAAGEVEDRQVGDLLISVGGRPGEIGRDILLCLSEGQKRYPRWRCGHRRWCPRCGGWAASVRSRRVTRQLNEIERAGWVVHHVTMTSVAEDVAAGRKMFVGAFGHLRRQTCWRQVFDGGAGQVELESSAGTWNVHAHTACWRHPSTVLDVEQISDAWTRLLGAQGTVGRFDLDGEDVDDGVAAGSACGGGFRGARKLRDEVAGAGVGVAVARRGLAALRGIARRSSRASIRARAEIEVMS